MSRRPHRHRDGADPWQGEGSDPWGRTPGDDDDDDEGDEEDQPADATSRLYRGTDGTYQHVKFIRIIGDRKAKVQFVDTGRVVTVRRSKLAEFDEDMIRASHFSWARARQVQIRVVRRLPLGRQPQD